MSDRHPSPLRYPGGKSSIAGALEEVIYANSLQGCTFVEPFAGGAGAALKLLGMGHVDRIVINDADRSVHAFWNCLLRHTDELVERIKKTRLSIREWRRQREIYRHPGRCRQIELGFAAFYLNRCNRSGIIKNGGPIGGVQQLGKWKLDARFNRERLAARVRQIAAFKDRITVLRMDATTLVQNLSKYAPGRSFIYADPPYYVKGQDLYLNYYGDCDHASFAAAMLGDVATPWVMTYDDVPRIRELYSPCRLFAFNQRYSAHHSSAAGRELFIVPQSVALPPGPVRHLLDGAREVKK